MRPYDDDLQRCFDEDLNDEEMRMLFVHMSNNADARKDFRSLLSLKRELQMVQSPVLRPSTPSPSSFFSQNRVFERQQHPAGILGIISSHISIRVPVFAMIIAAIGIAGYFAAVNVMQSRPKTEYVYVVEMPPVIIRSNYSN